VLQCRQLPPKQPLLLLLHMLQSVCMLLLLLPWWWWQGQPLLRLSQLLHLRQLLHGLQHMWLVQPLLCVVLRHCHGRPTEQHPCIGVLHEGCKVCIWQHAPRQQLRGSNRPGYNLHTTCGRRPRLLPATTCHKLLLRHVLP
jgi:hypothetical protein